MNLLCLKEIQLWVALPKEHEEIEASFYHGNEADLPMIEKDGHSMRLIAGEFLGEKSPVPVYSSLFYLNGNSQADSSFEFDLNEKQEAALYVINGELEIDGNIYKRYDLIVFKQGSELNFKAKTQCEYMIFGGDIFEEGRHIWWNFVSSSKERIEQAKEDWKNGKFKPTINETDLIPLPEN
jgi:redox-sensitive bicupin YhaK (pirin superfamily)